MDNDYSLLGILKMLAKWKKHILLTSIATFIVACLLSLTLPNYYKASTTFYAANPLLANPTPLGGADKITYLYGSDDDVDRLISIANSHELYQYLITKFNLAEHYDINDDTPKGKQKVYLHLSKLYEITKTKYGAIQLSIEDVDPNLAKEMVTATREKISDLTLSIVKDNQKSLTNNKLRTIAEQEKKLAILIDTIRKTKEKYGIFDSKGQGEILAEQLTITNSNLFEKEAQLAALQKSKVHRDTINKIAARIAGIKSKKESLDSRMKLFNEGFLNLKQLEQQQIRMADEVALEKERISKLEQAYEAHVNVMHIVEKEIVPNEKSRPRRSILVLAFTFMAFVLSSLVAIFIESTRQVNWKEIYAGK